jgi:O-antigen/teichoic acid export membrane protein
MSRLRTLAQRSDSNLSEVARGGMINTAGSVVGAVATFALLMLVVRGAGVDRGGLYFQSLALVSGASILCSLGGAMAITRSIAQVRRGHGADVSAAVWTVVVPVTVFSLAVTAIGYVVSGPLAHQLTDASHQKALRELLATMMLAVPFVVLTRVFTAISRAVDEPTPGALYDFGGQPVLRVLAVMVVLSLDGGDMALGWSVTGPALVCAVLSGVHAFGSLGRAGIQCSKAPVWERSSARGFFAFGLPRGLEEVVQASSIWLLTLMVGALSGPAEAATYAALTRLTMGTSMVLQSVTTGLLPRLSSAFIRHEHREVQHLFHSTTRWLVVLSLPMCVLLFVYPSALLALASPDLPGGRVGLQILAIGALVNVATGAVGGVVLMAGRSAVNLAVAIVCVIVMVASALILVPAYGASGAAAAWALSMVIQNVMLYLYARIKLDLSPWSRAMVRPVVTSAMLSCLPPLAVVIVAGDEVWSLIVAAVLSCAGLAFSVWRTRRSAFSLRASAGPVVSEAPAQGGPPPYGDGVDAP